MSAGLFACKRELDSGDEQSKYRCDVEGKGSAVPLLYCDVKYIPLETTDDCLISNVDKIIYQNEYFYILDKESQIIFEFDSVGKNVSIIDNHGSGSGEYINAHDIDVDNTGNVYVSDLDMFKIIKYNAPDYTSFNEISFDKGFMHIAISDSVNIFVKDVAEHNEFGIKLALYNTLTHKVTPFLHSQYPDEIKAPNYGKSRLCRSNDKFLFYDRFTPYIYQLCGDSITKYCKIVNASIPNPDEATISSLSNASFEDKLKQLIEPTYMIRDVSEIYENDKYIFIFCVVITLQLIK